MAAYGHIYLYMQPKCTRIVWTIAFQYIYSQEPDVCYTKLIQLWFKHLTFMQRAAAPAQVPSYKVTK